MSRRVAAFLGLALALIALATLWRSSAPALAQASGAGTESSPSTGGGDSPTTTPPAKPIAVFPREWTYADSDEKWAKLQRLVGRQSPRLHVENWMGSKPLNTPQLKGQIVLIDFWATWCGPCRESVPENNSIIKAYADKGVTLLGVCCTRGSENMSDAARKLGIAYPTASDVDNKTASVFGVMWWPFYVLVDRQGVVRAAGLRPDTLDDALDLLLAEQPPKGDAPRKTGS